MTPDQFDVCTRSPRSPKEKVLSPVMLAARMVLVDGVSAQDAAERHGVGLLGVRNQVSRIKAMDSLIRKAYRADKR